MATALGMLRMMARYHVAATDAVLASVPTAAVATAPVRAGFGSIIATANHIAAVDELWLARVASGGSDKYDYIYLNNPSVSGKSDDELWFALTCGQWDDTKAWCRRSALAVHEYIHRLPPDDAVLTAQCAYRTTDKKETSAERAAALLHLFNHATDHRGQIHAALAELGHDGAIVDMPHVLGRGHTSAQ